MSETIITKTCRACKETKPISEFYKHRSNKDGHYGCCKSCTKEYQTSYKQSKRGKATAVKYNKTPKGKAVTVKYRQTPKGKAVKAEYRKTLNGKAHTAVHIAIRAGKLQHPDSLQCHYCPKPAKHYHHWHGYEPEHWLDVVPVCIKCHGKEDRKIA